MISDSEEKFESSSTRLSAPITGFVDYNPKEQYLFNHWIETVRSSYESFGFTALHLRPFERIEALKGEGDTQKQIFEIYRADTQQTTHYGLPFDHTVPLALWVSEHAGHNQNLSFPYKRYDLGLSFRGERPKTGRCRAFVQADVDIIGKKLGLSADSECIAAILTALDRLDIGNFTVKLNHIGIVKSILKSRQIPEHLHAAILRSIDKLDKISEDDVAKEIHLIQGLSLSEEEIRSLISCFSSKVDLFDELQTQKFGSDATPFIEEIKSLITIFKTNGFESSLFEFSQAMVRGLAYYTGIVFETFLTDKSQYGSIASGGRYSNLVGDFAKGLEDVEGVGGSIGLTRIFDVLCKTGLQMPNRTSGADILVGPRTSELNAQAYKLCEQLRKKGLKVDFYSGAPKVKQILSHANLLGVKYTALIMDSNAIVMKNMHTHDQVEFTTIEEALSFCN